VKIALYSTYFLPVSGGVQSNIFELACGLSEWRHASERIEVTVITRTAQTTAQDSSWPFQLVRRPSFARLIRLLREADVIHIAGPVMLPMAIGLALRKPVVIEHHGYQAVCPNGILLLGTDRTVCPGHFMAGHYGQCLRCNAGDMGWVGSLRSLVLQFPRRWLCKLASVNVVITDHVGRRVVLPRTQTILYGISDPGGTPVAQNGHPVEIGYVGRLVQEKGLSVLLDAAKKLHDDGFAFHLTFVGDGPLRNELEEQSRQLGVSESIKFTGGLAGADLERAVNPLQIVVMPSLCEETAGLSAIEQMMRGGIIVASNIGGLSEVVGDAGMKFPPGDSNALYGRLRAVLQDPHLAAALASGARVRAKTLFARTRMIGEYVHAYRRIVCNGTAGLHAKE
jgi:glycosyltransferase involved in cell wall biosynthesis